MNATKPHKGNDNLRAAIQISEAHHFSGPLPRPEDLKKYDDILPGAAFHRSDSGGDIYINLPPDITWRGTVVLLRIPDKLPQGFDYAKYME